jgi:hypothetical protein
MQRFTRTLRELDLKEMYLNGHKYTWYNESERATLVRLGRISYTMDWELQFPSSFMLD